MKTTVSYPLIFLCLFAPLLAALADPSPAPPPAVPASLDVPANQSLVLTLTAKGVQIYECRALPTDPTRFEWAFQAPEADLFDPQGRKIGRHFAGPTWELTDGGKVVGKVKAKADAPDGQGVPWLLLEAVESGGSGILSKVQSIQRVNTVGGKAPAGKVEPAQAGQLLRVDYTATYKFYAAKP